MISPEFVYALMGVLLVGAAVTALRRAEDPDRRLKGLFWGAFGLSFVFGSELPDWANGAVVVLLAAIAASGRLRRSSATASARAPDRPRAATPSAARLFAPALAIPLLTFALTLTLPRIATPAGPLVEASRAAPICLGLAVLGALALALALLRPAPGEALERSGDLLDAVSWTAALPQSLAALGAVFAVSGVGDQVGRLLGGVIPPGQVFMAICAYTGGMALLTVLMGNAFAAFPVMASALGVPLLVRRLGADPAVVGSIGMLSGFCGTLLTPMAANFNLVPSALLELRDRYGVIRAQAPTAVVLFVGNTLLLYFLAFRPHG